MTKQVYVPMEEMVYDVWGVSQCECGETTFVVWRPDLGQFDEFHLQECVPYTGEVLPDAKDPEMPMPWKTREAKEAEREQIKQDEHFRREMEKVGRAKQKAEALRESLSKNGVEVNGMAIDGDRITITGYTDFYGAPSPLGEKLANKIKADAEKRAQEGTRAGMLDPRGGGEMDINMGTERK